MRTLLMLSTLALAACGATNPNQENYDAVKQEWREANDYDAHGGHGGDHGDDHGKKGDDHGKKGDDHGKKGDDH